MTATADGGLIFISCGQVDKREIELGKRVCDLVRELTPHRPYFAENQSSLDALTRNVLASLDDAVGLIAVMHPRGTVALPDKTTRSRASVWIEQEIAIAAFIAQILGRPLQIAPYIHTDVRREGMREQLQLNAVSFTDDGEVLQHLRDLLPSWANLPLSLKSSGPPDVDVAVESGRRSNFLLRFTNREDDDVSIRQVRLMSNGIGLTDPWGPDRPEQWTVPAHSSRQYGKSLQRDPADSLKRIGGFWFNGDADLTIVARCLFRGHEFEIPRKCRVRVAGTPSYVEQVV